LLGHRLNGGKILGYTIDAGWDRPLVARDGSIWFEDACANAIGRLRQ